MRTYTQDNWFRWGYDHVPFTRRVTAEQQLTIDFGKRASRPVGTVFDESVNTAKLIYETHGAPTIQYSGGLDSELVVSAFRHAKVPFKCFIMRYDSGINSHDVDNAVEYCEQHRLKYDVYDLEIRKFLMSDEATQYAYDAQTKQIAFTAFYKGMKAIDGFVLHGGGEPVIERQGSIEDEVNRLYKHRWVAWEHERYYSNLKFMMMHDIEGVPCFYQYNPEMWLSIFKCKYVQRMVRNFLHPGVTKSEDIKQATNEGHSPKVRIKYTGFERILDEIWDHCNLININADVYCNDDWTMPYSDVLKALDYKI